MLGPMFDFFFFPLVCHTCGGILLAWRMNVRSASWKWTSDQCFSTTSAYRALFMGQTELLGAKILEKKHIYGPGKCKFFICLLKLHDRCWMARRSKAYGLQDDDSCALCDQESESIDHLLVGCLFAREI